LPTLSIIAFAGLRMIGIASRLSTEMSRIRFAMTSVPKTIAIMRRMEGEADWNALSGLRSGAPDPVREIVLENVTALSPDGNETLLSDLNISLAGGLVCGIVGPSGAGKSTLLNVLLGVWKPDEGRVLVDGQDIYPEPRHWQDRIGLVPQSPAILSGTIRENVAFGIDPGKIDDERVRSVISAVHLDEVVARLPDGLLHEISASDLPFSGGQVQRLAIARALYQEPSVLVLDEATSALDGLTEENVLASISRFCAGCTIIIVTHRIDTMRGADMIVVIDGGRVVDKGTYDELLERSVLFRGLARQAGSS